MERDLLSEMMKIWYRNLETKYLIPVSKHNEVLHRITLYYKYKKNDNNRLNIDSLDINQLITLLEQV